MPREWADARPSRRPIEAQTDLDWCSDPSELERALVRLVDLEPREDVAVSLQQKFAQLRLVAELGPLTQH